MKRGMKKVVTLPKDQADKVLQILGNGLSFDWMNYMRKYRRPAM